MKKAILIILDLLIVLSLGACKKVCEHEFGEWVVTVEETCSSAGERQRTCEKCGEVEIEEIPVYSDKHSYEFLGMIDDSDSANYKCKLCGKEEVLPIRYEDLKMPILRIDGDFSKLTASKNSETFKISYEDATNSFSGYSQTKLQGASSINYPKKNYSLKLYEDENLENKLKVELIEGVGKQNKYTLKANWIDASGSRNIVSGKIFSDIAHYDESDNPMSKLINGGTTIGYPVCLFENGKFHGLYTMNVAKDDYMFGMDDDDKDNPGSVKQAVFSANSWNIYSRLGATIPYNLDYFKDIEIEYISTEKTIGNDWAIDGFNNMIRFINNNNGQAFIDGIEEYVDVDRVIDCLIYTYVISASDNLAKNVNYVTYDGKKWSTSVYDMDGTWGLCWNGSVYGNYSMTYPNDLTLSVLYKKIFDNFTDRFIKRYSELRKGPLSYDNIKMRFEEYFNAVPETVWQLERAKWPYAPSISFNNLDQILQYAKQHLEVMDDYFLED